MEGLGSHSEQLECVKRLQPIECGRQAATHFAFEEGYRNLNHGSYGAYPIEIRSVFRHYQDVTEAAPDRFIRYEYRTQLLDDSRAVVARYINAPDETCVYVKNATTAIDTVLHNIVYNPGDVVVCFASVYASFHYTLQFLAETLPLEIAKIDFTLPVSDDWLCNAFVAAGERGKKTFPPGQSEFLANFASVATYDDNPYLCVEAALEWRKKLSWGGKTGEEAAMGYMRDLAHRGGQKVASILGTEVFDNEEKTMTQCNFTNVRLPLCAADVGGIEPTSPAGQEVMAWIMKTLIVEHHISANVGVYANAWWARLGSQVYLTLDDFVAAGEALKAVCKRVQDGEGRAG